MTQRKQFIKKLFTRFTAMSILTLSGLAAYHYAPSSAKAASLSDVKDATPESGKEWLTSHEYSSLSDVPILYDAKAINRLNNQIQWIDFTDSNDWTDLQPNGQLKVGSTFRKTMIPGYEITLRVKELKPFSATDVYRRRVEGTPYTNSYNPNQENLFNTVNGTNGISGSPQTKYAMVAYSGLVTGSHKTTLTSTNDQGIPKNGTVAGVIFDVSATYYGKPVKPGIIMTSGEEVGDLESEIYTTNGTPWELLAVLGTDSNSPEPWQGIPGGIRPHGKNEMYGPLSTFNNLNNLRRATWIPNEIRDALSRGMTFATRDPYTAGLGSHVFGGFRNNNQYTTPVVSTANPSEIGFYILTSGIQSSMVGLKFSDFGDLPKSYGSAEHLLRTQTYDVGDNSVKHIQQPYLGKVKADIDSVDGTSVTGEGSDDNSDTADEGVDQLIHSSDVHTNASTGEHEISIIKSEEDTYNVSVIASVNGNNNFTGTPEPAYVRGFIDFNGNGKFDPEEASAIETVTENNQKVTLRFTKSQIVDTNRETVNFRVRIANDRAQVEKPIGIAFSGEVEDNQIRVALPPRGDKEETSGAPKEVQRIPIEFVNRGYEDVTNDIHSNNKKVTFTSYGKIHYSDTLNSISAETTEKYQPGGVKIVNEQGELVSSYTKPGQGTYAVTSSEVTFTPEDGFVGKADGVVLRAVDENGHSTGWTIADYHLNSEDNNDGSHSFATKTMDAVYVPNVSKPEISGSPEESTDYRGISQNRTVTFRRHDGTVISPSNEYPVKFMNPQTHEAIESTTIDALKNGQKVGEYVLEPATGKITFNPNNDFVGDPDPAHVILTAKVGTDKDGRAVTSSASTYYQPHVHDREPSADKSRTYGDKGKPQHSPIKYDDQDEDTTTLNFYRGHDLQPLVPSTVTLLNDKGEKVTSVTVPNQGTYTLDDGFITFTPTEDFVGTATPVRVQVEDKFGKVAITTYTPTVKPDLPATGTFGVYTSLLSFSGLLITVLMMNYKKKID